MRADDFPAVQRLLNLPVCHLGQSDGDAPFGHLIILRLHGAHPRDNLFRLRKTGVVKKLIINP